MHRHDPNFSKIKILLPPEISTVEISGKVISLKNLDFPWESRDIGVLLVEISEVLPVEISPNLFSSIRAFTGKKKKYVNPTSTSDLVQVFVKRGTCYA